jgi:hypothetical protein
MQALVAVILMLAVAPAAAAERLVGRAKAVDGDTLEVAGIRVRLQGVAAPEIKHPGQPKPELGGPEAAAFMARLVDGQTLVCELTGERTQTRRVGVCRLEGRDVGAEVIAAGLARGCPRFRKGRYAVLERPAARSLTLPGYCKPRWSGSAEASREPAPADGTRPRTRDDAPRVVGAPRPGPSSTPTGGRALGLRCPLRARWSPVRRDPGRGG